LVFLKWALIIKWLLKLNEPWTHTFTSKIVVIIDDASEEELRDTLIHDLRGYCMTCMHVLTFVHEANWKPNTFDNGWLSLINLLCCLGHLLENNLRDMYIKL
jgi:hypothetical protein